MAGFEIEIDAKRFARQVNAYWDATALPKFVDATNAVAEAAKTDIVDHMKSTFDNPTRFTLNAIGIFKARPSAKRDPDALVFVRPQQAKYLDIQIFTGVRRAGDYATTALGPLVPGPDGRKNANGNLPRGYVARMLRQKNVAWVQLKPGAPPALVKRTEKGMQVLALIVKESHYDKERLPFYDLVEQSVRKEFPIALERAFATS